MRLADRLARDKAAAALTQSPTPQPAQHVQHQHVQHQHVPARAPAPAPSFTAPSMTNEVVSIVTRLHARIRKKLAGTPERPRLAVFRSQSHIYAQLIDDEAGRTLCAASSLEKALKGDFKRGSNVAAAKAVGRLIADRAKEKGFAAVVFDRGGFQYHGRVKALADAAREGGLRF